MSIRIGVGQNKGLVHWPQSVPGLEVHQWTLAEPTPKAQNRVIRSAHFHNDYQIGIVLSGRIRNHYRCQGHNISAGQAYLIAPGEVHSEVAIGGENVQLEFFFLPEAHVQAMAAELTGGRALELSSLPLLGTTTAPTTRWSCSTLALIRACASEDGPLAVSEAMLHWVIAATQLFPRPIQTTKVPRDSNQNTHILRVREYLAENLNIGITLDDLSTNLGLSKYHLAHLFKNQLGITIHRYATHLKVCRAKYMLRQGADLAQVALDLGFADQAHFSRCFKRFTSLTPGQFRMGSGPISVGRFSTLGKTLTAKSI